MLNLAETAPLQSHNALRCVRLTPGQKVSKKYRKKLWKRECRNLKAIVPSVANKNVSEVEVIEEAVGYIEQLHRAIADRLGVLPSDQMISALHMMAKLRSAAQADAHTAELPSNHCHANQHLPSVTSQSTPQTFHNKVMTPVRL